MLLKVQVVFQTASLRADDHSTIGAILFAVLTPAIFWKRASTVNCERNISRYTSACRLSSSTVVIGGAGIGSAIGLLTHYGRTVTGDITPDTQIPDIPATSS